MISRVLIANRGEIALRIIRACKELGVETVAVFSEADKDAIYLRFADEAVCVGPSPASQSYLDISKIISAAEVSDAEAIHPGYGFLSENPHFAEVCESCHIGFIGPSPEASEMLGNKAKARKVAEEIGVPTAPGTSDPVDTDEEALNQAQEIGYPVMIKAAGGGGGKGMRLAHNDVSLVNSFFSAKSEAEASFKNPDLYLEKYITDARHIEIQIIADHEGNYVHLGERECSIQRHHQKLIEESPSPFVDESLRQEMGEAAIALAKEADYTNAGTVEFLVDSSGNFYFMEMNARLQVEHTVTEMVTGIDLVQEQIRVDSGEPLSFEQDDISLTGSSMECRINAEDYKNDFAPRPGTIETFFPPGGKGVRLDSHCYSGSSIPPYYDSMIGKLITHGRSREQAISRMGRALDEFIIEGPAITTTIPLHKQIIENAEFLKGNIHTSFLDQEIM